MFASRLQSTAGKTHSSSQNMMLGNAFKRLNTRKTEEQDGIRVQVLRVCADQLAPDIQFHPKNSTLLKVIHDLEGADVFF